MKKDLLSVAEELHEINQRLMQQIDNEEHDLKLRKGEVELVRARFASFRHDYGAAVDLFGRAFVTIDMTDESVSVLTIVSYAIALARTGHMQARDVAALAEKRLTTIPPKSPPGEGSAILWWMIAEVYAALRDTESAVRCLRASMKQEPGAVPHWLESARNTDTFQLIRGDAEFAAFEFQALTVPKEPVQVR